MAWIELHQTLPRHPKLARLASRLRIPRAQAAGHLSFLWLWALDYAPTGDLSALEPAELTAAADFSGDAEKFAQALREAGWIGEDGFIHDWTDYAGRLIESREKERVRKQEERALKNAEKANKQPCPPDVRRTSSGHPPDVARMSFATLPYPTEPNPTEPEEEKGAGAPRDSRFKPPSREELDLESAKIGLPSTEVDKFVAHYGSNGWKVGKNPMKSWPHALAGWKTRWQESHHLSRPKPEAKQIQEDLAMPRI